MPASEETISAGEDAVPLGAADAGGGADPVGKAR